jgi:hypothetical protein
VYFPHVDNIYSHRSTQTYKNKPFVSHYWDCRLKGRPSGTPKSTDPNKKKRKRIARERDLCEVKIKITEYHRGECPQELVQHAESQHTNRNMLETPSYHGLETASGSTAWNAPASNSALLALHSANQKWFSIQRVNGTGNQGAVPEQHRHSMEESDRVKKNSVQRHFKRDEKFPRPSKAPKQVGCFHFIISSFVVSVFEPTMLYIPDCPIRQVTSSLQLTTFAKLYALRAAAVHVFINSITFRFSHSTCSQIVRMLRTVQL